MDEHGRPAHEEAPRAIAPGARPRRLYALIGLLIGVIAILVVHPWGGGSDPSSLGVPRPARPQASSITGAPDAAGSTPGEGSDGFPFDPVADLSATCGAPSGWRAATLQTWAGRSSPIRSWMAIEPVEASGPLDSRIPFARVWTDRVVALGYCAPPAAEQRPPLTAVASLWLLTAAGPTMVDRRLLEPSSPNALGALWQPGPDVASDGAWPPGRYVVEIDSPTGTFRRWLGIQVEDLALLRSPSATAEPSPAAPAATPVSAEGARG
ncbi:MAG: hypothetical protein MUQ32_04560 [Chloroflexi bacterium]|nr:hypothetical protein [Chloroflexota bacterium]